jgi:hypothetical protein
VNGFLGICCCGALGGCWPMTGATPARRGGRLSRLRANRLPLVEGCISSITKRRGGWVPWRPVLKQVLPRRSQNLMAPFDPVPTSHLHRNIQDNLDLDGIPASLRPIRGSLLDQLVGEQQERCRDSNAVGPQRQRAMAEAAGGIRGGIPAQVAGRVVRGAFFECDGVVQPALAPRFSRSPPGVSMTPQSRNSAPSAR